MTYLAPMELIRLSKPDGLLRGDIVLDGSKSISNRALIVLALAGADPADWLTGLSASKDTTTLYQLLTQPGDTYDAGDAGTTFRFLTAFLALQTGVQTLTGSTRMRERPIGGLVEALRSIGADIVYIEKEGYPPLRIGEMKATDSRSSVRIHAGTSSQFLSALLMIGPYLKEGLQLIPEGKLVSRPYLEMTLQLMRRFGAEARWQGNTVLVAPGRYQPRHFVVEADWSAASYWYAMAALADDVDLRLHGLSGDSWQGDSVIVKMMQQFGIQTDVIKTPDAEMLGRLLQNEAEILHLKKSGAPPAAHFEWDFTDCPDIAQSLAVVCAGLGVPGTFSGLETLLIKETDRVSALQTELAKVGVLFREQDADLAEKPRFLVSGKAQWGAPPRFATYGDHRMAMSFAPLAFRGAIDIENPAVVVKSYPAFWEHLKQADFLAE